MTGCSVYPGDEVLGCVDARPGTNVPARGSVAEYVQVTEGTIRPKPAGLTWQEAAAIPLAATVRNASHVGSFLREQRPHPDLLCL